jgi:hypothetical protein
VRNAASRRIENGFRSSLSEGFVTKDEEFESKHPRGEGGEFASGAAAEQALPSLRPSPSSSAKPGGTEAEIRGKVRPGEILVLSPDNAVYTERQKMPKWNVPVSPLSGDFSTSGKILRQRLPDYTKEMHLKAGDSHSKATQEFDKKHRALVDKAWEGLKKKGIDPGPLIAGVVSDKFDDKTKDQLRELAHLAGVSSSAAMAHYAAAKMRLGTALERKNSTNKSAAPTT